MKHLIISREYPPAAYPPGGIGTYVSHLARLLAEAGETVHVIGQLWEGEPRALTESSDGRLIVHRVPLDEPLPTSGNGAAARATLAGLVRSPFPAQAFSWQAALLSESLVEREGIDLIEAQEWEAPLYFFQLRRALGLGPTRRPPCFVHLHSPTEFIFRHNRWDLSRPDYLPTKRQEDYSITAADALLCPSRYLARQSEAHYGLAPGSVEVIPLPLGEAAVLERSAEAWASGPVCYVGRIEPRKGVTEWVDAAVSVAHDVPSVEFEFVGSDTPLSGSGAYSLRAHLETRIPASMRHRFHFRGGQSRADLPKFLSKASIAVVPSRWENFPNTCVEAMASGLPVIASPEGGMAEMLSEGETGWIAGSASRSDLAEALRRALGCPGPRRAEMGTAAAAAVRRLCDNATIVARHLEFRGRTARGGSARSSALAPDLPHTPGSRGRLSPNVRQLRDPAATAPLVRDGGIALILSANVATGDPTRCIDSVLAQTEPPAVVFFVTDGSMDGPMVEASRRAKALGWRHLVGSSGDPAFHWNAGLAALLADSSANAIPLGVSLVDTATELAADFIASTRAALSHCPELGIVSFWSNAGSGAVVIHPCPGFPYQWIENEVAPGSVIRAEALHSVGPLWEDLESGDEQWGLFNAILAEGWAAVTLPALLTSRTVAGGRYDSIVAGIGRDQMRRRLLEQSPGLVSLHSVDLAVYLGSVARRSGAASAVPGPGTDLMTPGGVLSLPRRDQWALVQRAARNPSDSARWLWWHTRRAARLLLRIGRTPP